MHREDTKMLAMGRVIRNDSRRFVLSLTKNTHRKWERTATTVLLHRNILLNSPDHYYAKGYLLFAQFRFTLSLASRKHVPTSV